MTKHVNKKSACLVLAILIAVIALAIPGLSSRGAAEETVGADASRMEQNRSRAPSSSDANLDLPEGLLDLEDNRIGRRIEQSYIDTEEQTDNTQSDSQLNSNDTKQVMPSNSLLNAARNEGDENAKRILENEIMWSLIGNSDEAAE